MTLEKKAKKLKELSPISKKHTCDYCNKEFARLTTLERHLTKCVKREKELSRRSEKVKIGYELWASITDNPSILKFERSNLYIFFTDFAQHCIDNNYVLIHEYGLWLIKNKVFHTNWTTDKTYKQFIGLYLLHENPSDAVSRSIEYIVTINLFGKYFKNAPCGMIINNIETGKISPWLFFVTNNPEDFLNRLRKDQLVYFKKIVNMGVWESKMERYKRTVTRLRNELKDIKL